LQLHGPCWFEDSTSGIEVWKELKDDPNALRFPELVGFEEGEADGTRVGKTEGT